MTIGGVMMTQHILRNERGTTLIQVLGAVVILTMIILSFVGISQYTTASNRDTDRRDEALFIAEEIVNTLRADVTTYDLSGTVKPSTKPGFKYRIDRVTLTSTGDITIKPFLTNPISSRYHVTLQAIMKNPAANQPPQLFLVTVLWEG